MVGGSRAVMGSLGVLFGEGTHVGLPDGELLDRFATRGEGGSSSAFEGLLLRHGPMVLDVCFRVLGDPHEAQDAFQATFLVLASRARSIRRRDSVGSWLHGVALRVARRARAEAARRRLHERRAAERNGDGRGSASISPDGPDRRAIHEEIGRLPEKYREAVVLCYLEGLTLQEAAGRIGCPVGTLGVRLMRARERLRDRLTRRGLAPDDAPTLAIAPVPGALMGSTIGAAARIATGGTVPLASSALALGVLRGMAMVRLARSVAAALTVVIGIGSVGVLSASGPARTQDAGPGAARLPVVRAAESWIGKKAVLKYSASLKEGGREVGDDVFRVYTVDRVDGDRVHLASDEASGWTEAGGVVLLDEAIDFYTEELRRNEERDGARMRRAQVRFYLGDRAGAIAELTEAIRSRPPRAMFFGTRGAMFWNDNEYDRAIADYDEAIRLQPMAEVFFARGQCRAAKHEYDRAIADYDEAIRIRPDSGLFHLNRGLARAHLEHYEKAIDDYERAIELGTNYTASAHRFRGSAWRGLDEYDKAIADFTEAIRLDPGDAVAHCERGIARLDKASRNNEPKAPEQAIADFTEAIRLDPDGAQAYGQRGRARVWNGEMDRGLADCNRAIQLDPRDLDTWICRGRARMERGDYDAAISDFSEAIRLDPKDVRAWNPRGQALFHVGEYDRAISDFDKALGLDPDDWWARSLRGTSWLYKKDDKRAQADFDEVLRHLPDDPNAHLYRGLIRLEKKDYDGAIADFDAVLGLDPDRREGVDPKGSYARINRAWAWFRRREYAKAMADYDEAARIDPENPDVADARAWAWATCPDPRLRDGKKAVETAERLCKSFESKVPHYLATLAAACAEVGDFDAAVRWQSKANAIDPDASAKEEGEIRLTTYRAKKPYRDDRP